jgi:hypothetical protein
VKRRLFSFDAAYLGTRLYLVLGERDEPWNGLLVCTSHEHHAALLNDFPQLAPHQILGKWLYISQSDPQFEHVAQQLVALALERDPRLGIDPPPKKPKKSKQTSGPTKAVKTVKPKKSLRPKKATT